MSMVFGAVSQIGIISRDLEQSVDFFATRLGIGPWFVMRHYPLKTCLYRGTPIDLDFSVALSNSGSMQIEIVQQNDNGPSMYREFLDTHPGRTHIQHVAFRTENVDAAMADLAARGFFSLQEGTTANGRFGYLVHPQEPGICVEISVLTEQRARLFRAIEEEARAWDGTAPLREGMPRLD